MRKMQFFLSFWQLHYYHQDISSSKFKRHFYFLLLEKRPFSKSKAKSNFIFDLFGNIFYFIFLIYNDEFLLTILWYILNWKKIILVQQRSYNLRDFFMRVAKTAAVLAVLCTHKVPFLFTFNLQSSEVRSLCLMKWVSKLP